MAVDDRLKKRLALSASRRKLTGRPNNLQENSTFSAQHIQLPPANWMTEDDGSRTLSSETDELMAEVYGNIDDAKITSLIDACQKECLQAVIRPFGLGRVLFEDKLGGNVATIHNVRRKAYRESDDTAWAASKERAKYDSRDGYIYADYHDKNKNFVESRKQIESGYDLDHSVSCLAIHNDTGVYLAELSAIDVANISENHNALSSYYNRAKGSRGAKEFVETLPGLEIKRANAIKLVKVAIQDLEQKQNRTEEQNKILDNKKKALALMSDAPPIDPKKVVEDENRAKAAINKKIYKTYYSGSKFIKSTAITSLNEGGKMALQQAIGVLLEEFVRASFIEVKDVWKNGFSGNIDDTFIDVFKTRLIRIVERVHARWADAVVALKDGFISGFISNILTIAINTFMTTVKRWVRIIREGFMSLYRSLKMLVFPPEGMSPSEAAHAASKLFAAGVITGAGILLEEVLEKSLLGASGGILAFLAPYITSVVAGLVTGLSAASAVYMLDRLDLFGVNTSMRQKNAVKRLNEIISLSYDEALEVAKIFDGPTLLHKT